MANNKIVRNLVTIGVACAMGIFTIYMFYPGIINADSSSQLMQARLFKFSDWHPPIMSFLWLLLNHFHDGVATMLVFHNLIFWCALAMLAFWIFPQSNLLRILFLIFFGFFPTVISQLGMVVKDTAMAVSLFLTSVLFLYARETTSKIKRSTLLGIATIFLFYGFAVRLNSMPAVAVLCLWFGDIVNKKSFFRSLLIGTILFICLVIGKLIITENILHPIKTYPFQQVQLHDLTAIALAQKKPIFPEYILRSPNFSMSKIRELYLPANVGELVFGSEKPIRLTNNKAEIQSLNRTWLQAIYQYPWDYLKHRSAVFGYMLYSCMAFWDDVCRISFSSFNYEPGLMYRLYCRVTLDGPLHFLFHGWIYMANSILIAILAIHLRRRFPDFKAIVYLTLSGLLYVGCSFFYAPACEFRYVYWVVIASLAALALLIKNILGAEREKIVV